MNPEYILERKLGVPTAKNHPNTEGLVLRAIPTLDANGKPYLKYKIGDFDVDPKVKQGLPAYIPVEL